MDLVGWRAKMSPPAARHGQTQEDSLVCRNIRPLFNFKPVATDAEVRASALQYVRKISGMRAPSRTNHAAFEQAVDDVAVVSQRLLASLVTTVAPKSREEERAKARMRWERRAARLQASG